MKKRVSSKQSVRTNAKKTSTPPSREYIQALRGKFRGKALMKALMAEKQREREL
jgi:hypothetical protein